MINHDEMRRWITKRAVVIRVQTDLGTAVKVTKVEAVKLIDTLERRGVVPNFDCMEVRPGKYLITIQSGISGIYVDN